MGKKNVVAVTSSAAEYLTYIASTGDLPESFEMRYEDENIWLTQKMMATLYDETRDERACSTEMNIAFNEAYEKYIGPVPSVREESKQYNDLVLSMEEDLKTYKYFFRRMFSYQNKY